jgi:hypothetical protein
LLFDHLAYAGLGHISEIADAEAPHTRLPVSSLVFGRINPPGSLRPRAAH